MEITEGSMLPELALSRLGSLPLLTQIMKALKLARMWKIIDIVMCRTRNWAKR